jgi:hypothetical protein
MMLIALIMLHTTITKINSKAVTVTINTTWDTTLDLDAIEKILRVQDIKSIQPFKEFAQKRDKKFEADNNVLLVTLDNGVKAVFKPGEENIGEVIAYKASKVFNKYHLVPPTVYRQIGDEYGSLQLYIETDVDLLIENAPLFQGTHWKNVDEEQVDYIKMFYFIFGQWDINAGNQLIIENNDTTTVALIDNSGIANLQQVEYGDYAFIRCGYSDNANDSWDEPFPFKNPQQLKDHTLKELQQLFGEYMSPVRITKFWNRYNDKQINYCFWRNALWVQYYKVGTNKSPLFIEKYSDELINDIQKITDEVLEDIWQHAKGILPKQLIQQLKKTTLDRIRQVLKHATHRK